MNTNFTISFLWILFLMLPAATAFADSKDTESRTQLNPDLYLEQIQEDVFLVVHCFPGSANSLLVRVTPQDVVFVDTPCENTATACVIEWVRKNWGKVNILEINTGFHWDNLGGNEYLESQKIPVYGSDVMVTLLKERAEAVREETLRLLASKADKRFYEVHKNQKFVAPDHIFKLSKGLRLEFGDEIVEVFFPGQSHTFDNVVVYFSKRKLLFGGCMIKSLQSNSPGFIKDANMEAWPKSVNVVLERYPNAQTVIPGHGNPGDTSLLLHTFFYSKTKPQKANRKFVRKELRLIT